MASFKKGFNRVVAEAVEKHLGERYAVRKNILERDEDYITSTSITPREWAYTSTICPGEWAKKKAEAARVAVARAEALNAGGWRGLRVVIAPKEAPSTAKDFFNRVAPAYSFFEEVGAWLRRVNAVLDAFGISVALAARHAALIAGEIRPHLHLLVMRSPDSKLTACQVRQLIAQYLGDIEAMVEPPAPRVAGFINNPRRLAEYVTYLHNYPVTYYEREGVKGDLRDLIATDPHLYLASIAALTCKRFTLKGSVVSMGVLKEKPASLKIQTGPIRVGAPELGAPDEEPKEGGEGVVAGPATLPTPIQRQFGVVDPWARREKGKGGRRRGKKDPNAPVKPAILHIITRPSRQVVDLEETIAHLRGCRGWSRAEIEDYFPFLGEKWRWERYALRMSASGLRDETVVKALAKAKARAGKQIHHKIQYMPSHHRPRRDLVEVTKEHFVRLVADAGEYMQGVLTRAVKAGERLLLLRLVAITTRPHQLALPSPNYGQEAVTAEVAAGEKRTRENRRHEALYFTKNPRRGEGVIITPPSNGRYPRPALLSFAATRAERVAEVRAEVVKVRREVRVLEKKASDRLRRVERVAA